jgi:tRNA dimethylallyltransferase
MRPRLVCIVGPTASGKSALAMALAERVGGEIVSADSRQVYRGLDVGTAKPTADERARVLHHCLDLVEPGEAFDAARFRRAATAAITLIVGRGRVPLVVGGTGLYVRALLRGLCPAPPRVAAIRDVLSAELARQGPAALHRRLADVDPALASRVAPRDGVRIVRGLEVAAATGVPLSRWQAEHGFREHAYDTLVIGLDRPVPELDARIAARARAIVAGGLLAEVAGLARRGAVLDALGYREMRAHIEGRTDVDAAIAAMVRATRQFAKRQRTWFRREPGIVWYHPDRDREAIADAVDRFLSAGDVSLAAPA